MGDTAQLRIRGYSHITRLGATGGSSSLYSAVRDTVGDRVAIKVISLPPTDERDVAESHFRREREALERLRDVSGIIALFDWGKTDDGNWWYLTMPLLDRSLEDVLETRGPLSQPRMALIMSAIASAAARAHSAGVLHRDIKPANILLTQEGAPYLADFGIARMKLNAMSTGPGVSATPYYAPPEIFLGEIASEATDVYSIGMTCWAALIGRPPFLQNPQETPFEVIERLVRGPAVDPTHFGIDGEVGHLLRHATARDPAARPGSAALASALDRLVPERAGQRVTLPPAQLSPSTSRPNHAPSQRFGPGPPVFRRDRTF